MNKITKIFNNIGFFCSNINNYFISNKTINGYQTLDNSSIGYYIPYLVRNIKDNFKWEIGVGQIKNIDGKICVERVEISSSSKNNQKVNFTGNENEFYLFVNNSNFNSSFNNVILKNDHFNIDNVTSIYLVDNSEKSIDCVLPTPNDARNVVVDVKALHSNHNVIIRLNDGKILESINDSIRLVSDGQSWYVMNSLDSSINFNQLSNDDSFNILSSPNGDDYSFQYKDGNNLAGSNLYWSSGNSNQLLLGSDNENNAHSIIPTSGSQPTIFNKDLTASDFIIYGSGQLHKNLFFSYDGRIGINIPSGSRPQTIFHVVNYSCSEILRLENRTSCQPAKLTIYHKPSSSLANNSVCSILNLAGKSDSGAQTDYALVRGLASDPVNRHGGLVLSVASGNNQQNLVSGDLSNITIGYNNSRQLISNNGNISLSGSNITSIASSSATIGTNNAKIIFDNNTNNILYSFNSLFLGSGSVTSNGLISANNISTNTITLPNIAPSSILGLSNNKTIVPINGVSVDSTNNTLIFNNISGNKFLTTDNNKNIVGLYDLDDYFLTEKDIIWNKYSARPCSICLKQVTFDIPVPIEEFSIGDQVEIINNNLILYRTIVDITLDQNNIVELILNQNVTNTVVNTTTIFSVSKGGYLSIQKNTNDAESDSSSIVLSIRPDLATIFNKEQKNIDFAIYGTNSIPALKVYASVGSKNQISGIYYDYATKSNSIAAIPINVGGSGINTNFSTANFNYTITNNLFSGILSSVGTNGVPSYYGTYDQNGNIAEWLEPDPIEANNALQYAAGGSIQTATGIGLKSIELASGFLGYSHIGFRIASISNISDSSAISSTLNFSFQTIDDIENIPDTEPLLVRSSNNVFDTEAIVNLGYVDQKYRISTFETTNSQYSVFLNCVATGINNTSNNLYDTRMSSENMGGILRNSNGFTYSYTTKSDMANKPVNFVSYINAIKFTNWLHNGTPSGNAFENKFIEEILEDGAYSIFIENNTYLIKYNNNKKYFLPNLNQWHKAAYFEPVAAVIASGKPIVTINTDSPYVIATENLDSIQTQNTNNTVAKQILADLTVSGWLVVDKIFVKDGTIRSMLPSGFIIPGSPDPDDEDNVPEPGSTGILDDPPPTGESKKNKFWLSSNTVIPRLDGVFGIKSPPLIPDGTLDMLDLSCNDPSLIAANNLPFWCDPNGKEQGPRFFP